MKIWNKKSIETSPSELLEINCTPHSLFVPLLVYTIQASKMNSSFPEQKTAIVHLLRSGQKYPPSVTVVVSVTVDRTLPAVLIACRFSIIHC